MIEEEIALLEHRLTSTQSQLTSNLIGHMLDDIDAMLNNNLNETNEMSPTNESLQNEIERLQTLKKDMIQQAVITSRRMADRLNTIVQIEQNKFSLMNRYMASTYEWQKVVFDTIETRRLHMIERANFIIKHKLLK